MKYLLIIKILIVFALTAPPAFAIKKCTEKYTVGYSQLDCPKTAIKSEVYVEKLGDPPRNPMPRYKARPENNNQQTGASQKANSTRRSTDKAIDKIPPTDADEE